MIRHRSVVSSSFPMWPAWLPSVLAALAALLLYAVTLGGTYIYDDVILQEDARFTSPHLWGEFWTQDYMPGAVDKLYRPLTCMTLAIEYSLHGDRPWIYHLVNWLLHAAVAAAVAELARRLMGFRVAIVAGLLFAVHPVHIEAVAGLVGRAELLCTLAMVGAMVLFLKPMTGGRVVAICACLIVALLSKEQGILLPGMLLAMVPFVRGKHKLLVASCQVPVGKAEKPIRQPASGVENGEPRQPTTHASSPFFTSDNAKSEGGSLQGLTAAVCLISAAYLLTRQLTLGFDWDRNLLDWTANPLIRSTGADRLLMPLVLLGHYVILLIAPLRLSLDYGTYVIGWTVNWHQPFVYLGMAAVLAWLLIAAWAVVHKYWAAVFCLLALALSYGMVGNFPILIGTILGERLMYLPSVFFLILAAALLSRLLRSTRALAGVVAVIVALASVRTFTYARLWNHPLALYLNDLHDHPNSQHLNGLVVHECIELGKKYEAQGKHAEAMEQYRLGKLIAARTLKAMPEVWEAYQAYAAVDIFLHEYDDAKRALLAYDHRCPGIRIRRILTGVEEAQAQYAKGSKAGESRRSP